MILLDFVTKVKRGRASHTRKRDRIPVFIPYNINNSREHNVEQSNGWYDAQKILAGYDRIPIPQFDPTRASGHEPIEIIKLIHQVQKLPITWRQTQNKRTKNRTNKRKEIAGYNDTQNFDSTFKLLSTSKSSNQKPRRQNEAKFKGTKTINEIHFKPRRFYTVTRTELDRRIEFWTVERYNCSNIDGYSIRKCNDGGVHSECRVICQDYQTIKEAEVNLSTKPGNNQSKKN